MVKYSQKRWWSLTAFAVLTAIVFMFDIVYTFGAVGELLYLAVIVSAILLLRERDIFTVAVICSAMALLGGVFSADGTDWAHMALDRGLVVLAIWLPAVLVVRQWRAEHLFKQENAFLQLLQRVAVAANQAAYVEEALHTVLDEVCRHTGWPVGHAYLPADDDSGELKPTTMWHLDDSAQFEAFRRVTEATRFAPGIGLPGRVLVSGKPAWIIDVTKDPNFPRAKLADDIGVRAAFGFPVLVGEEVAAVLEFFSTRAEEPDESLLEVMASVGTDLGRVIERQRAAQAIRESEQQLQSITDNTSTVIYIKDIQGRFLLINRRFEEIFKMSCEQVIGKTNQEIFPKELADQFYANDRMVIDHQGPIEFEEVALHADDGQLHTYLSVKFPLYDAQGGVYAVCGISTEITERKKSEQALRDSEQRYRALYDDNPSMFFTVDGEGKVISVNRFGASQLGYTPCELIGESVYGVVLEEDWPIVRAHLAKCIKSPGQIDQWEFRKVRKDGCVIWVREAGRAIPTDSGESVILIVCEDITQNKHIEQEREQLLVRETAARAEAESAKQRVVNILERVGDAFVALDKNWCYTYVNEKAARTLNRRPKDLIGKHIWTEFPEGVGQPFYYAYQSAVMRQTAVQIEEYYEPWDMWFENRVYPSDEGLSIFFQDITQRKKSEQALRDSEQRFKSLFDHAAVGIAHVDMDGRFIRVNPEFCKTLGYTQQEMLELTFFDVTHPDDIATSRVRMNKLISGPPQTVTAEKRYVAKNGSVIWGNLTTAIVDPEGDNSRYLVSVIQDITERKRAQEQARQRQAELAHVTRMSTIGELASGLAHEINQPLAAISNYVQVCIDEIRSDAKNPNEMVETLSRATAQCHRASQIIARLRHFIAKREPRRDKIDVNKLVREVVSLVEAELRSSKVKVDLDLHEPLESVHADSVQIEQVIMNLVKNGLEAMDNGSADKRRLMIQTFPVDRDAIKVTVKDTGHGLSKGEAGQVFEPFFTTKSEGMGMGLSISRTIIEAHGGRVTGTANPDQGATFEFVLPTKQKEPT